MHSLLRALALLFSLPALTLAADPAPIVDLSQLDKPPERIERHPLAMTEALRSAGVNETVTMVALIDTTGHVASVENVSSATAAGAEAATASVMRWVFSPCFSEGKAVAFKLPVAVAIRPALTLENDGEFALGSQDDRAGPDFRTFPKYPAALASTPVHGFAVVDLTVDETGKPSDPVVEYATRTEFAESAAAAVLEWVYTPAKRDGAQVASRCRVEVPFTAESAAWTDTERDMQSRLQYARSYDEAPRQQSAGPVVFPYDALIANQQGGVSVNVIIDPTGLVAHATPAPGANPDFLGAVKASLATWRFIPATKAGQPVFGVVTMQFTFDPYREEFQYDTTTYELIKGLREGTAPIYSLKQVTKMPAPSKQVQPIFPVGYGGPFEGEAMIEFVIDPAGRAQLPKVISATNPELGWAAATAVAQWRFAPAEKDGTPVMCRARVPVRFTGPKAAAPSP